MASPPEHRITDPFLIHNQFGPDAAPEGVWRRRPFLCAGGVLLAGFAASGAKSIAAPGVAAEPRPDGRAHHLAFAEPSVPEGFLLDGAPFQIRSGEMHPARIPVEHWRQRILMARAMGLNTIALYIMWNHIESEPGLFDVTTGNRDFGRFIRMCAQAGMWVYLRPGPYVCAEWDFGGLPPYLLRTPDVRVRDRGDATYMRAVQRYIAQVASIVRPLMAGQGGPILMMQIENEYASFGRDLGYLAAIRALWEANGLDGPFTLSDGLAQIREARTYLPGTALGLDGDLDFAQAREVAGGAPLWVGEGYPGWLTHWGEPSISVDDYGNTLRVLMRERRSFNLYVVHGGTNFGFSAGANAAADGKRFQPVITSYDYGAPINENGAPTPQYHSLRQVIADASGFSLPAIPPTPALVSFDPVITAPVGSLWSALPPPTPVEYPQAMEPTLAQDHGMVLYRHTLSAMQAGRLLVDGVHDDAVLFLDGARIGRLSRVLAADAPGAVELPPGPGDAVRRLDILVDSFGHVNYGQDMHDRKGILGSVRLDGNALTGWEMFGLPLDGAHLDRMRAAPLDERAGLLHQADFTLDAIGDTYLDMSAWQRGYVWVNGHLLGRHWSVGPQNSLFCPVGWLRRGRNHVTILDLLAPRGLAIQGGRQSDLHRQLTESSPK